MDQSIKAGDHVAYMRLALLLAEKSPPKPTNFRVGAVLVDSIENRILATGFTLELPGNTHAEQCCLHKYATEQGVEDDKVGDALPVGAVIYTTVEPCVKRLSGNKPCLDRIVDTRAGKKGGIRVVYVGVLEPTTFVAENDGQAKLAAAGVKCVQVPGMEEDILEVAKAGHKIVE